MKALFRTMALAARWANEILFDEMAKLTEAQWTAESAVNFGNMRGIANHLLLADLLWLRRLTGEGPAPVSVDATPFVTLEALRHERRGADERVIAFAEELDPARLATTLRYTTTSGQPKAAPFDLCVAHFFNHQTHHRGQLHAMLGLFGIKCPDIDLIYSPAASGHR